LPVFDYLGRLVYVKTEEDFRKINAMVGAAASSAVHHILESYKKACEDDDMSLNVNKELTNFHSNLAGVQVESENMNNLTLDLFEGAIEFYKQEANAKMEELKQRVMTEKGVAAEGMKKLDGMDKIFLDLGKDFVERSKK
jgi:pyrroline-5-carboxylate reductase